MENKPKDRKAKVLKPRKRDTRTEKIAPVRLWVKARFMGFRRGRCTQNMNQAILSIEGVNDEQATDYYMGKRVAYVYKAHSLKKNTKYRAIWGKIIARHGCNGAVRSKFLTNLPAQAMGSIVRVMLYPQHDV